jgi:hypothetical protein
MPDFQVVVSCVKNRQARTRYHFSYDVTAEDEPSAVFVALTRHLLKTTWRHVRMVEVRWSEDSESWDAG